MSKKLRSYISVFLLLLYGFPIAYQTVHIIAHQQHKHQCCNAEHPLINNGSQTSYDATANNVDESCPVCEYQFTVFQVAELNENNSTVKFLVAINIEQYTNISPTFKGLHKCLRAPPFNQLT